MAKFKRYQQINVELARHHYPIIVAEHILSQPKLFTPYIKSSKALIVTNDTVAAHY